MVATLLKLKFRLLLNSLTREIWRLILTVIGLLYGLGVLAMIAAGAFFLGRSRVDIGGPIIAAGVVLTLAWVLIPLLAYGIDDSLDPSRFALFTTPSMSLGAGLLLAGGVTLPGFLTVAGLIAATPAWFSHPGAIPAWIIAALLGFATCLTLARLCTTAAATQLRSRRGRDTLAVVGMILLMGVGLVPALSEGLDLSGLWEAAQPVLAVLVWTPLGAPWAIPAAVAGGSYGLAGAHFLVALGWLVLLLWLWVRLLGPAMTMQTDSRVRARRGKSTFTLPQRLHRTLRLPLPAAAVAARALRYWRADPRYLSQAIAVIMIGPLLAVVFTFALELPAAVLIIMPVAVAFFTGWALHNDTAYDSTALWLQISSGADGRTDRLGRAAAFLLWALPILVVFILIVLALTGRWALAPAVFGAALGTVGAGIGLSMVSSAMIVYPVQPPGTSPFSTTGMGSVGLTFVVQTVTGLVTIVIAAPTLIALTLSMTLSPVWGYVTLAVGVATAAGAVWIGVVAGGKVFDQRLPAHLLTMRKWSGH